MNSEQNRLYGYSACYRDLDTSELVFKVGRTEEYNPISRLNGEFNGTLNPPKDYIEKNSEKILICTIYHPQGNSAAEKYLFNKLTEKGALRPWKNKELFINTSIAEIENAMEEILLEFGGKWLNYWDLKKEYNLIDDIWTNPLTFKDWIVVSTNRLDCCDTIYGTTPPSERAKRLIGLSVDKMVESVKAKLIGFGGGKANSKNKPSSKADIIYIHRGGLIKFQPR